MSCVDSGWVCISPGKHHASLLILYAHLLSHDVFNLNVILKPHSTPSPLRYNYSGFISASQYDQIVLHATPLPRSFLLTSVVVKIYIYTRLLCWLSVVCSSCALKLRMLSSAIASSQCGYRPSHFTRCFSNRHKSWQSMAWQWLSTILSSSLFSDIATRHSALKRPSERYPRSAQWTKQARYSPHYWFLQDLRIMRFKNIGDIRRVYADNNLLINVFAMIEKCSDFLDTAERSSQGQDSQQERRTRIRSWES